MSTVSELLTTARRAVGLTQQELAAAVGLTQAALSRYEAGQRVPDDEILAQLAAALGVTSTFLRRGGEIAGGLAVEVHLRRRLAPPPPVWRRLEARLDLHRLHAAQLFESIPMRPGQAMPNLAADLGPADAARLVRQLWGMPAGPVQRLVQWLEAAGCLVIEEDLGAPRVEALSQWVGGIPTILVDLTTATDRKRVALAHELGHLCRAADPTSGTEADAALFAAEFLLPAGSAASAGVGDALATVSPDALAELKRQWGVPIATLIEVAEQRGAITATQRANLYKAISARGWVQREPVTDELAPEHPELPAGIGAALRASELSAAQVAELAGFAPDAAHPFTPTATGDRH